MDSALSRLALYGGAGSPIAREARTYLRGRVELVLDSDERVPLAQLQECQPDLILSAGHHWMIGPKARSSARLGALGLHPSLLPAYRGSYPLWWALRNREPRVGLSLYHLVDRVDAGPIIDQREVEVDRRDTFGSLYERVAEMVPAMLSDLLDRIARTDHLPAGRTQDEDLATLYGAPRLWARVVLRADRALRARLP